MTNINDIKIINLDKDLYSKIPYVYSASFEEEPWEDDWYDIPQFNKESVWVAQYNDDIVGYILTFITNGIPYISVLATIPSFQRLGIATSLVDKAINYWRKQGYKEMLVHTDRKPALSFYKEAGFYICGYKENYVTLKRDI